MYAIRWIKQFAAKSRQSLSCPSERDESSAYCNTTQYGIDVVNICNLYSEAVDNSQSTRLSEIYAELQAIEADKAPAKAGVILSGLGFSSDRQQRPTR